jgi:hypothetical protein
MKIFLNKRMKNSEVILIGKATESMILTMTYWTVRVRPLLCVHQTRMPYGIRKGIERTKKNLKDMNIPDLYIGFKLNLAEVI